MIRDPKRVADKYIARDGGEPEQPDPDAGWKEAAREYHADRDHVASAPLVLSPLDDLIDRAADDVGAAFEASSIAALAKLRSTSAAEYEVRREQLKAIGVRVSALDKLVGKQQAQTGDAAAGQGRKVQAQEIKPWEESVDGAKLLDEISAAIRAHIVLTQEQADTVALYSVYSHAYGVFKVAPRLGVRAPTRECGKSELLLRVQRFVPRPLSTENLTGPVLFRLIEDQHPTLFVDELDNLLSDSKSELLGLFNSGYAKNGKAYRLVAVGDNHELHQFSTFCPLVYGMIGKPTDSFNSRSIPIEMRRATPAEWRKLLSLEDGEEEDLRLQTMGRKAARWMTDNLDRLKAAQPNMGSMTNRPATNWRPLFAVAEVVGGEWKARARAAAVAASKLKQTPVDEEELFAVIKRTFATSTKEYVESEALVRALAEVEDGPWAEYGKTGKPVTTTALARLLRRFGIGPGYVGPEAARRRGYTKAQFDEVFASYVFTPENDISKCAGVQNAMDAEQVEPPKCAAEESSCTLSTAKKPAENGPAAHLHTLDWGREVKEGGERVSLTSKVTPPVAKDPPADLPEPAAEAPPTAPKRTDPTPPARRTEPAPPLASVESLPDWMNRNLAPERREQAWQAARERLGPPAISAGADDDLGDL
jgi:hypothetical protein